MSEENIMHRAYYDHIKQGRNVVVVAENYHMCRHYIRLFLSHYRYFDKNPKTMVITYENQMKMHFIAASSYPHRLLPLSKNAYVVSAFGAFDKVAPHHFQQFNELITTINERTLSHGR